MVTYRYETHLHTSETSLCGSSSGAEHVRYFKSLGYTGVFVTDHFLNGNTTVPPDLTWSERIALFCHGYEVAAKEGAKVGLDVFFAWEYSCGWAHFLTYGLGKDWLLDKPDLLEWDLLTYLDRVDEDGGLIVHAHPFRQGIETVKLVPNKIGAVEVVNAAQDSKHNRHALDFATSFGLNQVAGSDIHQVPLQAEQRRLCGVLTPRRLSGALDYVAAVKSKETVLFDEVK